MTAKKFLNQYRLAEIKISHLESEIRELRAKTLPSGISYDKDAVQTSSGQGVIDSLVPIYIDKMAVLNSEKKKLIDIRYKVLKMIHSLDNPDHVKVLYQRYIEFKDFLTISQSIPLSYDRTIHVHGEALQAINQIINPC